MKTFFRRHNGAVYAIRKFVVGFALEAPAGFGFADAAPLFEEEGYFVFAALIAEGEDPVFLHRAGTGAAFAADDHPVDVAEIEFAEVLEERLDG